MTKNTIRTVHISALKAAPYNPRTISKEALAGLQASLQRFGLVQPIIVNKRSGNVVGGHQRLKALQAAGEREVQIIEVDLPITEEKALNVTLNNPAIAGVFTDGLQTVLEDIQAALPQGWLDLKLNELTEEKTNEEKQLDEIPPPGKAITKVGEMWALGDHRLLVGDSTDSANIVRLMGNVKASCCFTDPPYGVSYEARSGKHAVIKGDDLRNDALVRLLTPAFKFAADHAEDKAAFYIWHASSTREDFAYAMRAAGIVERQYLIWAKNGFAMGYSDYRWSHEPCFYASKGDKKPLFYGDAAESTVWRVNTASRGHVATIVGNGILIQDGKGNKLWIQAKAPANKKLRAARIDEKETLALSALDSSGTVWEVSRDTNTEHPTQKPVELVTRALRNSTMGGGIVYDPFLGSGTTLIGAEVTGRRCFGIELDPKYASVIIRRWEKLTGRNAKKC